MEYFRPIAMTDALRPAQALPLAGGWCWFDRVAVLARGEAPRIVAAAALPPDVQVRLSAPRGPLAGVTLDRPRIMGILNVTPDSFSDGGLYLSAGAACAQGEVLAADGADILDIGGESTRPGAVPVAAVAEIARTAPVIARLAHLGVPLSIDTRKADVAAAALAAGAAIVNDVSALSFDPALARILAAQGGPVVLMHAQGTPETMQVAPHYDDVLLDVYDFLAGRIASAEAAGIVRARIVVDPGIGFGKTAAHNLALLRGISLFHGLGCPVLLGASRKRFIGTISGAASPDRRAAGSLAVALGAVAQGVQILRVHDVAETRAALALWRAVTVEDGTW